MARSWWVSQAAASNDDVRNPADQNKGKGGETGTTPHYTNTHQARGQKGVFGFQTGKKGLMLAEDGGS